MSHAHVFENPHRKDKQINKRNPLIKRWPLIVTIQVSACGDGSAVKGAQCSIPSTHVDSQASITLAVRDLKPFPDVLGYQTYM